MSESHPNDPLHGVTLETVLIKLEEHYGWEELGRIIDIRCFNFDPSISSSLKFLRKTPWARKKVEELYVWIVSTEGQEAHAANEEPDTPKSREFALVDAEGNVSDAALHEAILASPEGERASQLAAVRHVVKALGMKPETALEMFASEEHWSWILSQLG